jgi:hypothetical protein
MIVLAARRPHRPGNHAPDRLTVALGIAAIARRAPACRLSRACLPASLMEPLCQA